MSDFNRSRPHPRPRNTILEIEDEDDGEDGKKSVPIRAHPWLNSRA
jgi:hypothetical protein